MLAWRSRFRERLDRIAAAYVPARAVDLEALSDAMMALVEGGLI
jgi:hypothetical protein